MIQTVLFDFDGTLFDTGEGILRSVQYALEGFGIHETDTARLRKFVGPPLLDSFSELYAMQPAQARAATERYRERYQPIGVYECDDLSRHSGAAQAAARGTDFALRSRPGSPRRWRARFCSVSIWSSCLTA